MTLQSSFKIASQGLSAQASRLQIHANNIANTDTPYFERKIPILQESQEETFEAILGQLRNGVINIGTATGGGGVNMTGTITDPTPGKRIYNPGHPEADKEGYVTTSNVNVLSDIADATVSARLYEANLALVGIVKSMANRALEIGRGQ